MHLYASLNRGPLHRIGESLKEREGCVYRRTDFEALSRYAGFNIDIISRIPVTVTLGPNKRLAVHVTNTHGAVFDGAFTKSHVIESGAVNMRFYWPRAATMPRFEQSFEEHITLVVVDSAEVTLDPSAVKYDGSDSWFAVETRPVEVIGKRDFIDIDAVENTELQQKNEALEAQNGQLQAQVQNLTRQDTVSQGKIKALVDWCQKAWPVIQAFDTTKGSNALTTIMRGLYEMSRGHQSMLQLNKQPPPI